MIQGILVIGFFSAALFYLGRKFYREYSGKGGHCDDCAVSEIDKRIKSH